jgi:hypothetical protein
MLAGTRTVRGAKQVSITACARAVKVKSTVVKVLYAASMRVFKQKWLETSVDIAYCLG